MGRQEQRWGIGIWALEPEPPILQSLMLWVGWKTRAIIEARETEFRNRAEQINVRSWRVIIPAPVPENARAHPVSQRCAGGGR